MNVKVEQGNVKQSRVEQDSRSTLLCFFLFFYGITMPTHKFL